MVLVAGGAFWGHAHLQCGVHDLVNRGKVCVPQELSLLLECQHALWADAADGRGDLQDGRDGVLISDPKSGQPLVLDMGQHHGTCRSSRSLPTTAALPQSMASEKGSSQPSLSSTGMQAACAGPHEHRDTGDDPSCSHSPLVPAVPPGSGRSPDAGLGARCRRWSCAAAPGSQTWQGKGSQAWAQHHPLPSNEAQCIVSTQIPKPRNCIESWHCSGGAAGSASPWL